MSHTLSHVTKDIAWQKCMGNTSAFEITFCQVHTFFQLQARSPLIHIPTDHNKEVWRVWSTCERLARFVCRWFVTVLYLIVRYKHIDKLSVLEGKLTTNRESGRPTSRPIDWLTDWLPVWPTEKMRDWLTDWLTDRWTDRLTVWPTDWLTDWLTDGLTGWLTYWLTDRPTDQSTDWPTDRLTDWLTDWLTDKLFYWLINLWLTDRPTDRPTDWLTDWRTVPLRLKLRSEVPLHTSAHIF